MNVTTQQTETKILQEKCILNYISVLIKKKISFILKGLYVKFRFQNTFVGFLSVPREVDSFTVFVI